MAASGDATFVVVSAIGVVVALGYTLCAVLEIARTQARLVGWNANETKSE